MSRITRAEFFRVDLPIIKTFVFASGNAGPVGRTAAHVFVKISDDDGCFGWGEARPSPGWSYETPESVLSTMEFYLGPRIVGLRSSDRRGLHSAMDDAIGRGPSTGQPIAKAAFDMAVHDLCARSAGLPLRAFLGGSGDDAQVELSYTVTAHDPAGVSEDVAEGRAAGFRHFNFKLGVEPSTDIAMAARVREAAGSGAFVWADANQALSFVQARRVAQALGSVGTDVLEQPLRADLTHLMPLLRRFSLVPLAMDESTVSPSDIFRAAADGAVDYLVIKIARSGGLWPSLQQLSIAEAAGLDVLMSGLTESTLAKVAACQAAAVFGFTGPAGLNGTQFVDDSALFPTKAEIESEGVVRLGAQPGVGIEPDEAILRQMASASSVVSAGAG